MLREIPYDSNVRTKTVTDAHFVTTVETIGSDAHHRSIRGSPRQVRVGYRIRTLQTASSPASPPKPHNPWRSVAHTINTAFDPTVITLLLPLDPLIGLSLDYGGLGGSQPRAVRITNYWRLFVRRYPGQTSQPSSTKNREPAADC
ncbi:MAG: hypothetical protein Q9169_004388 [Polycauliona sp. 2 TL-2023]